MQGQALGRCSEESQTPAKRFEPLWFIVYHTMIQAHTVGVRMYHGASIFETFVTSERPIRADLKTLPGAQQTQVIESET